MQADTGRHLGSFLYSVVKTLVFCVNVIANADTLLWYYNGSMHIITLSYITSVVSYAELQTHRETITPYWIILILCVCVVIFDWVGDILAWITVSVNKIRHYRFTLKIRTIEIHYSHTHTHTSYQQCCKTILVCIIM